MGSLSKRIVVVSIAILISTTAIGFQSSFGATMPSIANPSLRPPIFGSPTPLPPHLGTPTPAPITQSAASNFVGDLSYVVPSTHTGWIDVLNPSTWTDTQGNLLSTSNLIIQSRFFSNPPYFPGIRSVQGVTCASLRPVDAKGNFDPSGDFAPALNCLFGNAGHGFLYSYDEKSKTYGSKLDPHPIYKQVIYFPPGKYLIRSTLKIQARAGLTLQGASPTQTKILWGGDKPACPPIEINCSLYFAKNPPAMLLYDGSKQLRFVGITWDGAGIISEGIHQSYLPNSVECYPSNSTPAWYTPPANGCVCKNKKDISQACENFKRIYSGKFSTSFNEHEDENFQNLEYGIVGNAWPSWYQGDGATVIRNRFINNSKAGIAVGESNALDWWIWSSSFESCGIGITNYFVPAGVPTGSSFYVPGFTPSGSFSVFNSNFKNSTVADMRVGNPGFHHFSIRENYSEGNAPFMLSDMATSAGAHFDISKNTIKRLSLNSNTVTNESVIEIKNRGANFLMDNQIILGPDAKSPVSASDGWSSPTGTPIPWITPFGDAPSHYLSSIFTLNNSTTINQSTSFEGSFLDPTLSWADYLNSSSSTAVSMNSSSSPLTLPQQASVQFWRPGIDQDLTGQKDACGRTKTVDLIYEAVQMAAHNACAKTYNSPPVVHLDSVTYSGSKSIEFPGEVLVRLAGDGPLTTLQYDNSVYPCNEKPIFSACPHGQKGTYISGWKVSQATLPVPIGPVVVVHSPPRAIIENLTVNGGGTYHDEATDPQVGQLTSGNNPVSGRTQNPAVGIRVDGVDTATPAADGRVYISEVSTGYNGVGVYVNQVRAAQVAITSYMMNGLVQNGAGIKIAGGDPTLPVPNVTFFGGEGGDSVYNYTSKTKVVELSDNAQFYLSDFWFEGVSNFLNCIDSAKIIVRGTHLAPNDVNHLAPTPTCNLNNGPTAPTTPGYFVQFQEPSGSCEVLIMNSSITETTAFSTQKSQSGWPAVTLLGNTYNWEEYPSICPTFTPSSEFSVMMGQVAPPELNSGYTIDQLYPQDLPAKGLNKSTIGNLPLLTEARLTNPVPFQMDLSSSSPWVKIKGVQLLDSSIGLLLKGPN